MDKKECEVQLFGFYARQVSLERKVFLRNRIRKHLEWMANKYNFGEETRALLLQQIPAIADGLLDAFEEELATLEQLDTKYFTVPNYVLLNGDSDFVKQYTEADKSRLDREWAAMHQRFLENCCMIESLKMENAQYDAIEGFVEEELKVHELVRPTFKEQEFVKLQQLFKDLKTKLL